MPSFGIWDSIFLWAMLNNANTAFFHNHRDDPGVREWREEAERLAQDDEKLREKLDRIDATLAEKADEPIDESFLPADVSPGEAYAAPPDRRTPSMEGGGFGILSVVVIVILVAVLIYWLVTMMRATKASTSGGTTAGRMTGAMRSRITGTGQPYRPDYFRVGMTITADPTPFILAGDEIKASIPKDQHVLTVREVSKMTSSMGGELVRLYVAENNFYQLHLGPDGKPDECRYFEAIDEINPADAEEWAFWLAEEDGYLGWPDFQTHDGKVYQRIWSPGDRRIQPVRFMETFETTGPMKVIQRQSMLYGRDTGLSDPAPKTEYILLSAVEENNKAWVQVNAGIDINPATLSLA